MAIFLASTKSISRGNGQSAVASASYRAGCELEDKRYGKTHDYSKKHGVMSADIILPSALAAANADIDRSNLWNKAESAEKRKDARVAREWLVNLPHELSEQDRKTLAHKFAQTLADRYGTIADCAIHKPTQKEIDRGADPRNFHAHIMFTTRTAAIGNNNEIILTDKADIELSDTKRHKLGMERVNVEIKEVRQLWEQLANEKLAEHKHDLIDCRSYADQGKDIEPQLKMGSVATKLERDAYEKAKREALDNEQEFTGIAPVTIRGEINAIIAKRNSLVLEASNKIIFESREHDERINRTQRVLDESIDSIRDTASVIDRVSRKLGESTDSIRDTASVIERTQRFLDENTDRIKDTESASDWAAKRCRNLPKVIDEIANKHKGILSGSDWAAKRCRNLPKVIDENAVRTKTASDWVHFSSKRARDNTSVAQSINQSITEREKPAPSPFDNKYERAFFERKRRIDRAIRETDRALDGSRIGDVQRANDVKNAAQTLANILLNRHMKGRFDQRQLTVLDDFAKKLGINENQGSDFRQNIRLATDKINTVEVLENNPHVFRLLNFPSQEREHHQTVTADFDGFIAHVDKQRAELKQEYQLKLGRNDTSRVTAEILTVKPYLTALTKYANNSDKTDESRALAELHINKTIRLTAKQYENAYKGLNTLDSDESVQKHVRELGDSLSSFTTDYAEKLTEIDLRSINECSKVIGTGIEISNTSQRRNNLSPGF